MFSSVLVWYMTDVKNGINEPTLRYENCIYVANFDVLVGYVKVSESLDAQVVIGVLLNQVIESSKAMLHVYGHRFLHGIR